MSNSPTEPSAEILEETELPVVHLVLNTDCNAWTLKPTDDSPGVCRFCYRERNRVQADAETVRQVLSHLRDRCSAQRIVFTGGDPLMPYDNHLEVAVAEAVRHGFAVNLHTNGLLLAERYAGLRDYVGVYSLAIDGPDAATADWFRGAGYFERLMANIALLVRDAKALAFNTFTSPASIASLGRTAELIRDVSAQTAVEYWLISQYRPIGRADARKAEIYGYEQLDFVDAVSRIRPTVDPIPVFSQPTRSPLDPYPFRVWVLADGTVTVDLGSVGTPRNHVVGNLLHEDFAHLIRTARTTRGLQFPDDTAERTDDN